MKLTRENFGKILKKIRKDKKMSVSEMAEKLNLSERSIEHFEQGRLPARGIVEFYNLMEELFC